jgi:PKD domain
VRDVYQGNGVFSKRRYLYVKRNFTNPDQNIAAPSGSGVRIDQYTITKDGFLTTNGINLRMNSINFSRFEDQDKDVGLSTELSESESFASPGSAIKLAAMSYSEAEVNDGSIIHYVRFLDHESFGVSNTTYELINPAVLAIVPPNATETEVNYNASNPPALFRTSKYYGTTFQNYLRKFPLKLSQLEFSPSGNYLYVLGGGFVIGNYTNITYLGQIDINSARVTNTDPAVSNAVFKVRLKVQGVPGASLSPLMPANYYSEGKGYGFTDANYPIATWKGLALVEKASNGKLYFTKNSSNILFALDNPDAAFTNISLLPTNVSPGATNVTLTNNALILPDAIDQESYPTSNLANTCPNNGVAANIEFVFPTKICANEVCLFSPAFNLCDNSLLPIVSWGFGDGTLSSTNPSHVYTNPGFYNVTMTIPAYSNCPQTIVARQINVQNCPEYPCPSQFAPPSSNTNSRIALAAKEMTSEVRLEKTESSFYKFKTIIEGGTGKYQYEWLLDGKPYSNWPWLDKSELTIKEKEYAKLPTIEVRITDATGKTTKNYWQKIESQDWILYLTK